MSLGKNATPVAFVLTADMAKACDFYANILGLTQQGADEYATTFDLGGMPMRLSLVPGFVAGEHPVIGWYVDDIAETVAALNAKGVAMEIYEGMGQDAKGIWADPGGRVKIAWFKDAVGNVLSVSELGR